VSSRSARPAASPDAALASLPRRRLLELLRSARTPQDAHTLAAAAGLHVTTVRFHLDVLCRAGLVHGRPQPRAAAGRPRTVYSTLTDAAPDGYSTLTRLLSAQMGDTPAVRATRAEQAGVQWAKELTADAGPVSRMGAEEAARSVTGLFAQLGFRPELVGDDAGRQLRLHACPFRAVARAHPEVICSIHLGLLRGVLTELGAPATTSTLRPFVEPELCVVDLSPAVIAGHTPPASRQHLVYIALEVTKVVLLAVIGATVTTAVSQ